jgi:hypothetical protein
VALTSDRRSRALPGAGLVVLIAGLCTAAVAFVSGVQIS